MVYFLRHGMDDERYIGGWSDVPLVDEGIKQVEEISQHLSNIRIDKILCSDIKRAVQTAKIVNRYLKKPITYTEKLRELDKGLLTGMDKDAAMKKYPYLFTNMDILTKYPNGECMQDLYNRILNYFGVILNSDNTLFITHRGVINMVYYILNDIPLDMDKERFQVTHASLHQLDIEKNLIKKIGGK